MLCNNCQSDEDIRKRRKTEKLLCKERTTKRKLEVWVCPHCDGKALQFTTLENLSPDS